jgi:dipeptidase
MDLLRLALERCKTATEAIGCITSLLEKYGQDACGGYKNKNFYYHNSFLIADTNSAWVLETAGREWATEQVKDLRSISNRLSIQEADQLSNSATLTAKSKGWWKEGSPFDFQKVYSDWFYTRAGRAAIRQACTSELSSKKRGQLNASDCMKILQTHNIDEQGFKPSKANTGSVCMHATSLLNPSQTTGSMVAEIRTQKPHTLWLTGTSMPCLSVYIPFFLGTSTLREFKQPSALPDDSFWWRAEKIHRWVCKDYQRRKEWIDSERLQLQQFFIQKEKDLMRSDCSTTTLEIFSKECLMKMEEALLHWSVQIR